MEAEGRSARCAVRSPSLPMMPVTVTASVGPSRTAATTRHTGMQTSDEPITHPGSVAPPGRGGRRLVWALVATVIVAIVVVIALAGISALGVRRHLLQGRDALTRGKEELVDGDAASARGEFEDAHDAFVPAADDSRSIWLS